MSSSLAAPTTTYSFSLTTNSVFIPRTALSSYTTPPASPTFTPFEPAYKCCNRWSQYPLGNPPGRNASCVISNDGCTNHDAFWDLYACCNGAEPKAFAPEGGVDLCTGTCEAVGQSWQQLMACLEKRAEVVVCKPADEEIATDIKSTTASGDHSTRAESTTGTAAASTANVAVVSSTGAANSVVHVAHVTGSKVGVMVFALLACASAAGMFL